MRHQVAAFNQLDPHLSCKISMLEVSRVEHPRRQQHNIRLRPALRCQRPQRPQQQLRVLLNRPHVVTTKQLRKDPLHYPAIGQHIANPTRHPQIILEHDKLAVLQPDQVRPAYRDIDIPRHLQPRHLPPEVLAAIHHLTRHDPVVQNPPLVIDVLQKQIQRRNPLRQPTLDGRPLSAVMIRGSRSYGKIFSVPSSRPYTVNVMPWFRKLRSAACFRRCNSSDGSDESAPATARSVDAGRRPAEHLVIGVIQQIVLQGRMLELG